MEVRRLKLGLLAALLLATACGQTPPSITETPTQQEEAVLKSTTQVSTEAESIFRAPLHPRTDVLPALPFADRALKVGSAVQVVSRDGSNSFAAGGGATNVGTGKLLSSLPGSISWAVYQLPGLPASTELQKLNVEVSGGVFGGASPGYWIGLADFTDNSWTTLNVAQDDYQRLLTGNDFVSASGNVYVFVLVMDAQTVTIDSVSLTYDTVPLSGWSELALDSGPNTGWTPSIVVDYYGSAWLAWADHSDGTAKYAFGLATGDLSQPGNWATGFVDPEPVGKAYYTDIVMDPRNNLPVVSLNYVEQSADTDNSQAGMSIFIFDAQNNPVWLNFSYGKMDGATDTTIDFDPISHFFGIATCVTNANSPAKKPNAMYVRYIDMGSLADTGDNVIKSNTEIDSDMFFPHLRFSPAEQHTRAVADGARLFSNTNPPVTDNPTWEHLTEAANTGPFGSLAYNHAPSGPRYGITYTKDVGVNHILFYNSYDSEGAEATVEEVAMLANQGGSEWLAGTSQLAYTFEGEPLIAYSVKQGSSVNVKLARTVPGGWASETVNTSPSDPGATPQDVQVDLAVEPFDFFPDFQRTNRAFVTWHQMDGSNGEVRLAFKVME